MRRYKSNIIVLATIEPPIGSKKRIRAKVSMCFLMSESKKAYAQFSTQAQAGIIGLVEIGKSIVGF